MVLRSAHCVPLQQGHNAHNSPPCVAGRLSAAVQRSGHSASSSNCRNSVSARSHRARRSSCACSHQGVPRSPSPCLATLTRRRCSAGSTPVRLATPIADLPRPRCERNSAATSPRQQGILASPPSPVDDEVALGVVGVHCFVELRRWSVRVPPDSGGSARSSNCHAPTRAHPAPSALARSPSPAPCPTPRPTGRRS